MAAQESRLQALYTARCEHGHLGSQRNVRWHTAPSDPCRICSK